MIFNGESNRKIYEKKSYRETKKKFKKKSKRKINEINKKFVVTYPNWFGITGYVRKPAAAAANGNPANKLN